MKRTLNAMTAFAIALAFAHVFIPALSYYVGLAQ